MFYGISSQFLCKKISVRKFTSAKFFALNVGFIYTIVGCGVKILQLTITKILHTGDTESLD